MNWKLIRDIRYLETGSPVEYGSVHVRYLETIYPCPRWDSNHQRWDSLWVDLGRRFADKLAEHGFQLPGYHHVYIVLTPLLAQGRASLCEVHLEPWQRYVTVGMSPTDWASLEDEGKFRCLVALTISALRCLCDHYGLSGDTVEQVGEQVLTQGTELEILVKHKETKSYTVRVTYQISPLGCQSVAHVEYTDKKTGKQGKTVLTHLNELWDIWFLVSSVSVSKGVIRVAPRDSFQASMYTGGYPVPLELPVEQVLAAGEDRG